MISTFFDGFPKITVDPFATSLPFNELKYIIGHELGHYVLGHFGTDPIFRHNILSKEKEEAMQKQEFKKGKK